MTDEVVAWAGHRPGMTSKRRERRMRRSMSVEDRREWDTTRSKQRKFKFCFLVFCGVFLSKLYQVYSYSGRFLEAGNSTGTATESGTSEKETKETDELVSCAIAVMLMGSISFQMLLFYMVNHPDEDMQRYTWKVVSNTISIFSAVLLFQAVNKIVEANVIGEGEEAQDTYLAVGVDYLVLVFCLAMMQCVLAVVSGALRYYKMVAYLTQTKPEKVKVNAVEINVRSFGVLFAHLAGFASINAWGSFQQVIVKRTWYMAMLAVPWGLVNLLFWLVVFDYIREYIASLPVAGAGEDDEGEKDEFEAIWDESAEEAENEVAGLSLSFLTVQAIRFYLAGSLPNIEGQEVERGTDEESLMMEGTHPGCWWRLICIGLAIIPVTIWLNNQKEKYEVPEGEEDNPNEWKLRATELAGEYFTCGNAWCFFYGVKWFLCGLHFAPDEAILHVAMALFVSGVAFGMMFALDAVRDQAENLGLSESAAENIEQTIDAFGLLVGFAWEQAFDVALDAITESFKDTISPDMSRLLLSFFLVMLVFPAWKKFILPVEMQLEQCGTVQARMKYSEMYGKKFVDKNTQEQDLDKHHLVLKRVRRKLLEKDAEDKERKEREKEEEKEEQCEHCGGSGKGGCCRSCNECGGTGKRKEEEHGEHGEHKEKKEKKKKNKHTGLKHFIVTAEGMMSVEPDELKNNEFLVQKLLKDAEQDEDEDE